MAALTSRPCYFPKPLSVCCTAAPEFKLGAEGEILVQDIALTAEKAFHNHLPQCLYQTAGAARPHHPHFLHKQLDVTVRKSALEWKPILRDNKFDDRGKHFLFVYAS